MECNDNRNGFSLGVNIGNDFTKNVVLSNRRKKITDFHDGVLVEIFTSDDSINFFYLKEYDIVLHGGNRGYLLKYSKDVIENISP